MQGLVQGASNVAGWEESRLSHQEFCWAVISPFAFGFLALDASCHVGANPYANSHLSLDASVSREGIVFALLCDVEAVPSDVCEFGACELHASPLSWVW